MALDAAPHRSRRARRPLPSGVLGRRGMRGAGSDLLVEHVYVGPGRAGFLDVLIRMGAEVSLERHDPSQHTADIRARASALRATDVGGREVPDLIDEIPVLAVAAAHAQGVTTFADAAELKVKETDRIATVTSELSAIGAAVEPRPTAWWSPAIRRIAWSGGRPSRTATIASPWLWPSPLWGRRRPSASMGGMPWPPVTPASRRTCSGACHSHRRPRRLREVHRGPRAGRPSRTRLPRHRRHVPGGDLCRYPPGCRPRRRGPRRPLGAGHRPARRRCGAGRRDRRHHRESAARR